MAESRLVAVMSHIKIEDSDFLGNSAMMHFIEGKFKFTKTAISSQETIIPASQIKSLNRIRAGKVSGTNTKIFQNNFIGGPIIAMIIEMFGFAASSKKLNRPIVVHLKDGKFFRGKTDLDTFFEVQNAWLDSKDNVETV